MAFNNKLISEIVDQDLMDLIGKQKSDLRIDFKQQHYDGYNTNEDQYRREICKDISAMANAEGGYILIGVNEDNNKIAQNFINIPDTKEKANSISDICYQHIDPRILFLDVEPYTLRFEDIYYNLIIIRIPFSVKRPHGFRSNGTLNFVKRHGYTTKEYRREEFIDDIYNDLIAQHNLSPGDNIGSQQELYFKGIIGGSK